MSTAQFPENEIAGIFEKLHNKARKKKLKSFLLYLVFLGYFSLPSFQIPLLEHSSFRVTSLMEQRAIAGKMLFYPEQAWTDIDDVSPNLLKAVIAMEDGSFFNHKGVDWKELRSSLRLNNRRRRSARGGSTITMQLAKNLYLSTDKTLIRKGKEFIITSRMEKELSKKAILQNYINAVEWGSGIFGIKKAAEKYFGKDPADLTLIQCSRLAAVIPSPITHQPDRNTRYVLRRSFIIRGRINDVILFPHKRQ